MPEHAYVVVVQGVDPVRLRAVIEREGWQMPLAPFIADATQVALVAVVARTPRRARHDSS